MSALATLAPTYDCLRQAGCDVGQGYGIARPMPAEDLPGWIAAYRAPSPRAAEARRQEAASPS